MVKTQVFAETTNKSLTNFIKPTDVARKTSITIEPTQENLYDSFGHSRSFLNYPNQKLIRVNVTAFQHIYDVETKYAIILHELLGLMQIEVNSESNPFNTSISSRIIPYVFLDEFGVPKLSLKLMTIMDGQTFHLATSCKVDPNTHFLNCADSVKFNRNENEIILCETYFESPLRFKFRKHV